MHIQLTRKKLIVGALLLGLFVLIALSADACDNLSSPSTSTSSTSASSGSTIDCNKDANGQPIAYKEACQMIKRRYEFLNDANKYGYFYGFVQGVGAPVIEYVVQGGVFPVSDLVSNPNYQQQCVSGGSQCSVVLDKQQPDGTYGTNGNAEFGWTAAGNYFEWEGPYAFAQQPLAFVGQKIEGCKAGVPGC